MNRKRANTQGPSILIATALAIAVLIATPRKSVAQDALASPPSTNTVVSTSNGKLSGVEIDDGMTVFRGIPFAAPPVGDLRWRPPQPAKKWTGVRKCDAFGDVAWQSMVGRTNPPEMNEDCLYLNVWSDNVRGETKQPVMVWIHGGGLSRGWSSQAKYDGTALAREGVVVVSVNYRLGPLGFLAHPGLSVESPRGVSGNYGFLDQIESLKWIRQNIEQFGGDPDNVTIFGESAGGTSVATLCASPLARGLFHRAIMQSPWMFGYINQLAEPNITPLRKPSPNSPTAEQVGQEWASAFVDQEGTTAIAALRQLPAERLVVGREYYKTRVTVDGWLLPDSPLATFAAGKQANVPVIIGTTKDEGNYFTSFVPPERELFDDRLEEFYGTQAAAVQTLYASESSESLKAAGSQFVTDAWFVQPARQLLEGMRGVSSAAYQYQFAVPNRSNPAVGSPHAIDLKYTFGTLNDNAIAADRLASQTMIRYWTQFAKTGDPNVAGLPEWPAYDAAQRFLKIAEQPEVDRQLAKEACDVLDKATRP